MIKTFLLLSCCSVYSSLINFSSFCHSQTPAEQAQARMHMALKAAGMQIVKACTSTPHTTVKQVYSEYTYNEFTLNCIEVSFIPIASKCFINVSDITSYVYMYQVYTNKNKTVPGTLL